MTNTVARGNDKRFFIGHTTLEIFKRLSNVIFFHVTYIYDVCITIFAIGLVALTSIWTVGSYLVIKNLEEPSYTVLEKRNGYEIRQYDPYIIAETQVTGSYSDALNEVFRVVADYIFGNNTSKTSIAMTAPVLENKSESIAMTVPVINTLKK